MGMYDTIWVKCPRCNKENDFQSKGGDCCLENFTLDDCPADVLANGNRHAPVECDCGCFYQIDIPTRTAVETAARNSS